MIRLYDYLPSGNGYKIRLLLGVRGEQHDDVGILGGVGHRHHAQSRRFGLCRGRRALAQADDDVDAGLLQVQRVRMTLRAVADDRDLLAADDRTVGIGFS